MLTHFQCDLCQFRNMKGRDPTDESEKYKILIIAIRRVSLDAFWSREPGTVNGGFTMLRKMVKMSREELGLEDWLPPLGPYPVKDEVRIGVVCVTLSISISKGRYIGNLQ